jgi:uncharacterized membrane protein
MHNQNHNEIDYNISKSVAKNHKSTISEKLSDGVASAVGSWKFILTQSFIIFLWILFNVNIPSGGYKFGNYIMHAWDPYPFIFLNLTLSFQAAYTAPIIMMSQNRQSQIDRENAEDDYRINRESKMEVELIKIEMRKIHTKLLKHQEIQEDIGIVAKEIQSLKSILDDIKNLK